MAKFTPRKTAPKKTDRHYYSNENIYFAEGHGLPNCVCLAFGRLYELTDKRPTALAGQPEDWFSLAQQAGMKTGQEPKLGAIACWKKGQVKNPKDGTGHVATVEAVYSNGDFESGNSQYKGKEFFLQRITKASGYQYTSAFDFQGFIYCDIEFETENSSTSSTSSDVIIKAGTKFELKNVDVYTSEKGSSVGKRTGTYYAWEDAKSADKRIRMTNHPSRVGVANQVSFLVEVSDLLKNTTTSSTNSSTISSKKSYSDGDVIKLKPNATYYNGKPIPAWVLKKQLYYRGKTANGIKFSILKIGAITGVIKEEMLL